MQSLPSNQILTGVRAYEEALDFVMQRAQKTLHIFDPDLSQGAYASITRAETLRNFLVNQGQLILIVHDEDFVIKHCPRLISLIQVYQHAVQFYVTDTHVQHLKDAFVVADETYYLRRFHIDHARFKFSLDDVSTVSGLSQRFNELLASTAYTVSTVKMGL